MFVDEIKVKVIAGNGGDGCSSFRREKYVPLGGPDGGNGGKGSDIIFKVDRNLKTLIDLKYQKIIKGKKGVNGKGSNRHGKNADNIIIRVPAGTTVIDDDNGLVIVDLVDDNQEFVIAHGGRGGKGNKSFASHNNPAPTISEYGEAGEIRFLRCELKVLADVGLVGMPSVGKSSILGLVSSFKPKIAPYHFTTLSPNLGVVYLNDGRSFVMADLPGLIENAAMGAGLGDKFLKHISRTRVIAHVVDMGGFEERNPIQDFEIINRELDLYSEKVAKKRQIVVANKMDLPQARNNLKQFKEKYSDIKIIEVSALMSLGINEMLIALADELDIIEKENIYSNEELESHVIYKFKNEKPYTIIHENNHWIIQGTEIEKLIQMTKFSNDEATLRFARKLKGMGIEDELESLGAHRGDEILILDKIFIFKE